MEFNLDKDNNEEDSLLKQKVESMRFDLLKSELELTKVIAAKELDKLERKYHNLEELVSRLEQDIKISRERETKGQEKINNLLTKLEMNEKDYTEMLVKLKMKVFDLERVSETIRNLHCQKKSSFIEAGDLPSPSKVGINNSTREASTGQKGSTANLAKKRMFRTFDLGSTSTTNENNITAHSAKTTVQKEGPKDSTDLSKHDSRPKASVGQKRTAILEKKKLSQTLDSRSTSTTTNIQNITAHSAKNTLQEEDPKDFTNPSLTSLRPMNRAKLKMKRPKTSAGPVFACWGPKAQRSKIKCKKQLKASAGQRRTAILEKKKMSQALNSSSTPTATNGQNITAHSTVSPRKGRTFSSSSTKDSGKECKGQLATSEQIACTLKRAEMLQSNLKSRNPSFIKSMIASTMYQGFFLPIPSEFGKKYLYTTGWEFDKILEDESGLEYNLKYLSSGAMHGFSGGWRGFALAHNLGIGDALVFELTEPSRFKVHIIKAFQWQ